MNYKGYQLESDLLIGELGTSLTPKRAREISFSTYIIYFINCYRGGRNESFAYGFDNINK